MDRCGHLGEDEDGWVVTIRGHWYELCGDCATHLEDVMDGKIRRSRQEALEE
jgi:hypothetical protein